MFAHRDTRPRICRPCVPSRDEPWRAGRGAQRHSIGWQARLQPVLQRPRRRANVTAVSYSTMCAGGSGGERVHRRPAIPHTVFASSPSTPWVCAADISGRASGAPPAATLGRICGLELSVSRRCNGHLAVDPRGPTAAAISIRRLTGSPPLTASQRRHAPPLRTPCICHPCHSCCPPSDPSTGALIAPIYRPRRTSKSARINQGSITRDQQPDTPASEAYGELEACRTVRCRLRIGSGACGIARVPAAARFYRGAAGRVRRHLPAVESGVCQSRG